jgi:hypothetical protein
MPIAQPDDDILISRELLTAWAETSLRMNHLGTLIKWEITANSTGDLSRAFTLTERARRRAWELFNDLVAHGARKPANYVEPDSN